jgi:predicted MFS family arabinose efflux permease
LLVTVISFALLMLGGRRVILLIIGVVLLDLGVQGTHITNQSEIYRLRPEARSRLTTVYMTSYFVGGAVGSATSAIVFGSFGWPGVCLLGAAYAIIAVALWLTERGPRGGVRTNGGAVAR